MPTFGASSASKRGGVCRRPSDPDAEEIVSPDVIRSDPNRTLIPGFIVDAVCHTPFASHPSYTQGYYDRTTTFT